MSDIESKPKRVMTEEQKAKMKEGKAKAKKARDEAKAAGIEPPPKAKKAASDAESTDASSTTSSKIKRTISDEQKAKMKAGREAAKAKREADKAAGIETPKKERKSKTPSAPTKFVLTKEMWEAVLDEVKKDLNVEFMNYVKTKIN